MLKRRLTLLDLMAFVAVSAVGFWVARMIHPTISFPTRLDRSVLRWFYSDAPAVLMVHWAALLIGLRCVPPRPNRARALRHPGSVACVGIVAAAAFAATARLWLLWVHTSAPGEAMAGGIAVVWADVPPLVPVFVVGGWLALILGRRWSPIPDWIDRCGRVLGGLWCFYFPLYWLFPF